MHPAYKRVQVHVLGLSFLYFSSMSLASYSFSFLKKKRVVCIFKFQPPEEWLKN